MIVYLASPYSHPDPAVRQARYRAVCRAAAALLAAGQPVFSPIAHSHPLVEYGLPADWSFWQRYDQELLARCDELVVLMLPGWCESVGVQAEIQIARELGKPVRYLAPGLAPFGPTLAPVASWWPGGVPVPAVARACPHRPILRRRSQPTRRGPLKGPRG